MAITLSGATYIMCRASAFDHFSEKKTIEFLLQPSTTSADLIAIASGFDTFSNAKWLIEFVQVSMALGMKNAAVVALQDQVDAIEELVFSGVFPEVAPKGIGYKSIGLPAPIAAVYTDAGKVAATPPTGWSTWIGALVTNLVRKRVALDGTVTYTTGYTYSGGQLIDVGDVVGDG